MAKTGTISIPGTTVAKVLHSATASQLILTIGQYTITVDRNGRFPSDFNPLPGETIDLSLLYDPRV